MMQEIRISRRGLPARALVSRTAKLACGTALTAALLGASFAQPAAAQDDDTIVLTAGGSTLTVSPGNASAVSAVAEAHASPGHAETIGAAARAVADCEDGALAEGAAALAVAHPDEGALTQASLPGDLDAEAMVEEITAQALAANNNDGEPIRTVVEHKCHVDEEEKKAPPKEEAPPKEAPPEVVIEVPVAPPVQQLPDTGIGMAGAAGLSSLLAAASAAAALGSVALRGRRETEQLALQTRGLDD
jgi:hypothetical protein